MVTIRDIAQATGVSATTVSNVIHGRNKRVSAETIQSINDAIKELGYVPNMSARSLVSSSSKVIGFVNHVITRTDTNMMDDPSIPLPSEPLRLLFVKTDTTSCFVL